MDAVLGAAAAVARFARRPHALLAVGLMVTVAPAPHAHAADRSGTPPATAGTSPAAPAPQQRCSVAHYRVVTLPLWPVAINDRGEVLGTTAEHRAALWERRSGLHELPLPAGFTHSEGVSLNARGHVAALAFDAGFTRSQSFFIVGDGVALLAGERTRPYQLNDRDVIAGEALLPGHERPEPVLWSAGSVGTLEPRPLGASFGGAAKSIDEQGFAMGDAYDEQGRYYAFSWSERAGLERLDRTDPFSSVVAMNHLGHGVIAAFPRIFLYSPAGLRRIALAPRTASQPRALNDCDVIVGAFGPFADASRAFAWDRAGGFVDLNERIPAAAGWKLQIATAINNRGEIIGRGDPPGAPDAGFLLLPVRP